MRVRATELGVGATALGLSWLVARRADAVPGWEGDATVAVNGFPDWLAVPLWPVMQFGNLWMVAAVPAGLWATTRRVRPAVAGAIATGSAWALAKVVKEQVGRGRPADFFPTIDVRESGVHGLGYVSGHAAVAFAAATVIACYLPGRWKTVPFAVASITGLARIYFGAHLPLDIVGGAGLGMVCGALSLLLMAEPPAAAASLADRSQPPSSGMSSI